MYRYAMVCLGVALLAGAPRLSPQGPDGKALYAKNCQACHGASGTPPAALAKQMKIPRFDAAFMGSRSKDSLVAVMTHGGKMMKGFAGKLQPAEMAAIAAYLKEMPAAK